MSRGLLVLLGLGVLACSADRGSAPDVQVSGQASSEGGGKQRLARGRPPPGAWAKVPRFAPPGEDHGLRALPDGDLAEWEAAGVKLIAAPKPATPPPGYSGPDDLDARLGLASYGSGLSLAVEVRDDDHEPATASSAFGTADHVEIRIWPGDDTSTVPGLHLRLGTLRQLVEVLRPAESWRAAKISSAGAEVAALAGGGAGYRVEARIPLMTLTPLPAPRLTSVRYRVEIMDADGDAPATSTLRFEGKATLDPPLEVPEAVQKRGSVRVCMASQKDALWGYENGWRCGIPYHEDAISRDDTDPGRPTPMGYARVPTPPRIVWIRERVLFVNFTGVRRGVAALLDGKDTILSLLPLGVVGAEDPGNPRTGDSGAESLRLPDGTYALAVTHAYPAEAGPLGGRCAAGHRVFLSIVALRGCYRSTPDEPAPAPRHTPFLEEVFRLLLEDCETSVATDWSLSKDRRTIKVHNSLYPARPPAVWEYRDGRYRPRGEPGLDGSK